MKRITFATGIAAILVLSIQLVALADIPPPKRSPEQQKVVRAGNAKMTIESSPETDIVKLQIPDSVLKQLRAGLDEQPRNNFAGIVGDSPTRTIFAGVFLSLALASAGIWLIKSRSRLAGRAVSAGLLVCAVAAVATTIVLANAVPPSVLIPPGRLPRAVMIGDKLEGKVVIERVADDAQNPGGIKLIVPESRARKEGESK